MMPIFLLDQDECAIYGACSQTCVNTYGSYACGCVEGYIMQPDNRSCKAKNGKLSSFLFFQIYFLFAVPFPYKCSRAIWTLRKEIFALF